MGTLSSGLSNYMANKKSVGSAPVVPKNAKPVAPKKAPSKMKSHHVGASAPKTAQSSGKMASGGVVNLGTTVHKPGQGYDVSHPL